ncbi:MAG: oligopeptide transporter, OPT family [Gammaproteobacteria bacterium]|nr:oligopeptide transporter, OPT family [Gammaproteobacteria bacterium]MDE0413304.1 oligopeptide transporter, OPT family [Gammaproteobacteria bacterium]
MPQLTVKAIVTGVILSIVLSGANAYIGLFAGLTVSASIPAAVMSMAVLSMFKRSNILEHNIVQTAASAGESLAAGVIFTLPALLMLNYWNVFDYWWVSVIALVGGLLGVLYTIPLRHSLIVSENLAFPEGQATAQVLKAGQERGGEVRFLLLGAGLGAVAKFSETGLKVWEGIAQWATRVGGDSIAYIGSNLSPALVGVGYIVGINIASLVLLGGLFSWNVALPVFGAYYLENYPELAATVADMSATDAAFAIWSTQIRYLGVGAMIIGGLWALLSLRGSLVDAFRRGFGKTATAAAVVETDRDTPMRIVLIGVGCMALLMWAIYYNVVGSAGISLAMMLLMVTTGFLFSAVAAYMAGLVGSSNNPVSGVTIATILFSSLLMLLLVGKGDATAPAAVILIGGVVCCAAAIGGDNMQDLKAGRMVGSTPYKQQIMQVVGVVSAAFVLAPILNWLLEAYGIGARTAENPDALLAPQATLMASVAQGILGADADLPWGMIYAGMGVGAVIIICDEVLRVRKASFRMPVLAVAVGIYLPVELAVPIFIGGLVSYVAKRARGGEAARPGSLYAAGLITGEALMGILIAVLIVGFENPEPLSLGVSAGVLPGIVALAVIVALLYRAGARNKAAG